MFPCYSKVSPTHRFALTLAEGLRQELDLTPKPGLVDLGNNGSHADLSYALMSRSVTFLGSYFIECSDALAAGCSIWDLRDQGRLAEGAMLRRFGTNTHRGAIFLGGLMLAGVHAAGKLDSAATRAAVAELARQLFNKQLPTETTGARVRKRFGAGGIVPEALSGLPSVFEVGVPALHRGIRHGMSNRNAQLLAMAVLMQHVEDTTALRRCGPLGLTQIRQDGRSLERLLLNGQAPDGFLENADRRYRARRLTMGGIADLLGICIAWHLGGETSNGYRSSHHAPLRARDSIGYAVNAR